MLSDITLKITMPNANNLLSVKILSNIMAKITLPFAKNLSNPATNCLRLSMIVYQLIVD